MVHEYMLRKNTGPYPDFHLLIDLVEALQQAGPGVRQAGQISEGLSIPLLIPTKRKARRQGRLIVI